MIDITDNLENKDASLLISKIYSICSDHPYLATRTKKELQDAYDENRLLVAYDNLKIVGWVMRISLSAGKQELASAYIEENYRRKGIFRKLLTDGLGKTQTSVLVTYQSALAPFLLETGFVRSSFVEVLKVGGIRFLTNRLNPRRLASIGNHYKKLRPMYFVYTQ